MKMFKFGKAVCIVLALFCVTIGQASAVDITVDDLTVLEDAQIDGTLDVEGMATASGGLRTGDFSTATYDIGIGSGTIAFANSSVMASILMDGNDQMTMGYWSSGTILEVLDTGFINVKNGVESDSDMDISAGGDLDITSTGVICIGACD